MKNDIRALPDQPPLSDDCYDLVNEIRSYGADKKPERREGSALRGSGNPVGENQAL